MYTCCRSQQMSCWSAILTGRFKCGMGQSKAAITQRHAPIAHIGQRGAVERGKTRFGSSDHVSLRHASFGQRADMLKWILRSAQRYTVSAVGNDHDLAPSRGSSSK
ncbi:hypothetical protein F442_02130, partial [Phytophthora nicotianae P10297]